MFRIHIGQASLIQSLTELSAFRKSVQKYSYLKISISLVAENYNKLNYAIGQLFAMGLATALCILPVAPPCKVQPKWRSSYFKLIVPSRCDAIKSVVWISNSYFRNELEHMAYNSMNSRAESTEGRTEGGSWALTKISPPNVQI